MIRTVILIFFICAFAKANAQINLVRNPSFEQYSHCPDNIDEAKYAIGWQSLDSSWSPPDWIHDPNGVPEYCNVCATYDEVSVPLNFRFYHYPRTGNGMMQVQTFWSTCDTGPARDYLQGHLSQTLTIGHSYAVSFYTVLEDPVFGINHIGAYLDDGTIDTTHQFGIPQSQYMPQILDTAIITDTFNWTKVQGTFIANGTEKLITIGNFSDRFHTNTILIGDTTGAGSFGWFAWYLIDDVSIIDCANLPKAGNDTLIHPGDSVFWGTNELLIPYTWYVLGNSTPIDSGGGFWAHPAVTTTYVVRQDNICGEGYKYDTVVVHVWPDTVVNSVPMEQLANVVIAPNPASAQLSITGASRCNIGVFDMVGREVIHLPMASNNQVLDISGLESGVYFVHVVDAVSGYSVVRKVVKE